MLRAKIDMASPNLTMRDPILYRDPRRCRTTAPGATWCIYPMYDFAHCLSDSIEGITHSLCTLEFVDHRALYDWILDALEVELPAPQQIEFARGNLSHTVMSKRVLRGSSRRGTCAAGTTRACRRSRACAAAATRRPRSAASGRTSASRSATT